jgi:hypothetical protein
MCICMLFIHTYIHTCIHTSSFLGMDSLCACCTSVFVYVHVPAYMYHHTISHACGVNGKVQPHGYTRSHTYIPDDPIGRSSSIVRTALLHTILCPHTYMYTHAHTYIYTGWSHRQIIKHCLHTSCLSCVQDFTCLSIYYVFEQDWCGLFEQDWRGFCLHDYIQRAARSLLHMQFQLFMVDFRHNHVGLQIPQYKHQSLPNRLAGNSSLCSWNHSLLPNIGQRSLRASQICTILPGVQGSGLPQWHL